MFRNNFFSTVRPTSSKPTAISRPEKIIFTTAGMVAGATACYFQGYIHGYNVTAEQKKKERDKWIDQQQFNKSTVRGCHL